MEARILPILALFLAVAAACGPAGNPEKAVAEVNSTPAAQSLQTPEDSTLVVNLAENATDPVAFTYSIVSGPSHGTLTGTAPNLAYIPDADYNGPDSFTFQASDDNVDSSVATVSITVGATNDMPTANDQSVTTEEYTAKAIILTGTDIDGDSLTYSVVTGPSHGMLTGTAPNLAYKPDANYSGSDSFTFTTNDGKADSSPATILITVNRMGGSNAAGMGVSTESGAALLSTDLINFAPNANGQSVSTYANTPKSITLTACDLDGDALAFVIQTPPAHGALTGAAPNLTYTPSPAYYGQDSFTFKVNDGNLDSSPATVNISVIGSGGAHGLIVSGGFSGDSLMISGNVTLGTLADHYPTADPQFLVIGEDTTKEITLTGSDVRGDPLTFSLYQQPHHGTLTGTAPNLTYTPNANYYGNDYFYFRVHDGIVYSSWAKVLITVDKSPVVFPISLKGYEDYQIPVVLLGEDPDYAASTSQTSGGTLAVFGNYSPIPHEKFPLTFSVQAGPSHGTLTGTAPNLTYLNEAGFSGTESFTYRAWDGYSFSDPATVTIKLTPKATLATPQDAMLALSYSLGYSFILNDFLKDEPMAVLYYPSGTGLQTYGGTCGGTYKLTYTTNGDLTDGSEIQEYLDYDLCDLKLTGKMTRTWLDKGWPENPASDWDDSIVFDQVSWLWDDGAYATDNGKVEKSQDGELALTYFYAEDYSRTFYFPEDTARPLRQWNLFDLDCQTSMLGEVEETAYSGFGGMEGKYFVVETPTPLKRNSHGYYLEGSVTFTGKGRARATLVDSVNDIWLIEVDADGNGEYETSVSVPYWEIYDSLWN